MSEANETPSAEAAPPHAEMDALLALYRAGQLDEVVAQGEGMATRFPRSAILHDLLGKAHAALGQLGAAATFFQRLLRISPGHAEGHHNLGVVLQNLGRLEDAISCYGRALQIEPEFADAYLSLGHALQRLSRLDEAVACHQQAVRIRPDDAGGHYALGIALHGLERFEDAAESYRRTLELTPDSAAAHYNLGAVELLLDRRDDAIARFEAALKLKPDFAEAWYNLGNALCDAGKSEEGVAKYARALQIQPDHVDAHFNMGVALHALGRLHEAMASYRRALEIRPDLAFVHYNLGNALLSLDRFADAAASYRRTVALRQDFAEAHYNLGNALRQLGRMKEAIAAYAQALRVRPDYAEAYNNLGLVLERLDLPRDAITAYDNALRVRVDYRDASANKGAVLQRLGRLDEAVAVYEQSLALNPGHAELRAQKLLQQAHMCDWESLAAEPAFRETLGVSGEEVSPFALLPFDDDPARNRIRSERFAAKEGWASPPPAPAFQLGRQGAIRVGYFSADFHDHATMYLMARLFELHDRGRFSLHIFSYGPDRDDAMRRRLKAAADRFHDVRLFGDAAVAELARDEKIDIAVDLKGYTLGTRLGIFAAHPAPIRLSYLGYPGTLGTGIVDYIVADRVVIPDEQRRHYSENIVWLPGSYQVNDDRRVISDPVLHRADHGLPEQGFVFCSFNNSYKIAPDLFDLWMRLLQSVEGSILWLLKTNVWAERNLRRQAEQRGINADRLIFADYAPQAEHLARHRLADLFLDSFNVNAHTSASDALWAGLPLVTRAGKGFAARVAASLLTAVGLPELVTTSAEEYEHLALELASDGERLGRLRARLASNRLTEPLFDTPRFVRNIETAYQRLYDRFLAGDGPADIVVE